MIFKMSAIMQLNSDSFKKNTQEQTPCLQYPCILLQRETRPNLDEFQQIMIQIRIQNSFNCKYLQ